MKNNPPRKAGRGYAPHSLRFSFCKLNPAPEGWAVGSESHPVTGLDDWSHARKELMLPYRSVLGWLTGDALSVVLGYGRAMFYINDTDSGTLKG